MNFKHFYLFLVLSGTFIGKFIPNINNEHAQDYSCPRATFEFCSHGEKLGPVRMIPGQLIGPEQLTDPWINFASVHGLTPVTVHICFSLPWGNFERWVTRCTISGNPPCGGDFSPCEQNAKE